MRVFVTGGTGYVGRAVVDALIKASHDVTVLVRSPERADDLSRHGVTAVLGDLGTPRTVTKHAAGFDAYVHAVADATPRSLDVQRVAVGTLLDLAQASARYRPVAMVYTSDVWVLGDCPSPVDETAPTNPIPLVAWRVDRERDVLAAAGGQVRTMVVRPGIVYGGGRGVVSGLLRDAENGLIRVVGAGENHWALVYHRDLGDLYARLLAAPDASGVYHATDENDERVQDVVDAIVAATAQPPSVRHVPIEELRKKIKTADGLALDQRVRSPRARALGWAPSLRSLSANVPGLLEELRRERTDAS